MSGSRRSLFRRVRGNILHGDGTCLIGPEVGHLAVEQLHVAVRPSCEFCIMSHHDDGRAFLVDFLEQVEELLKVKEWEQQGGRRVRRTARWVWRQIRKKGLPRGRVDGPRLRAREVQAAQGGLPDRTPAG